MSNTPNVSAWLDSTRLRAPLATARRAKRTENSTDTNHTGFAIEAKCPYGPLVCRPIHGSPVCSHHRIAYLLPDLTSEPGGQGVRVLAIKRCGPLQPHALTPGTCRRLGARRRDGDSKHTGEAAMNQPAPQQPTPTKAPATSVLPLDRAGSAPMMGAKPQQGRGDNCLRRLATRHPEGTTAPAR